MFVADAWIGAIFRGCEVGDNDVGAVIKKGFGESTTDRSGTAGDQYVFLGYTEIRYCRHIITC
jgi:hypothetical protein